MAIHESRHQSDLEKRLRLLRQQMYGKGQLSAISFQPSDKNKSEDRRLTTKSSLDITYLQADLFKIATFSAFMFGAQIILYYLFQQNILKINLF